MKLRQFKNFLEDVTKNLPDEVDPDIRFISDDGSYLTYLNFIEIEKNYNRSFDVSIWFEQKEVEDE